MNNSEMKRVTAGATFFAAVSIALMLQRAATKHIMITDAAGTPRDRGEITNSYTLLVDEALPEGKENLLIIPLPESTSSDNIVLEDDYTSHELRIYVDSREEGFYKDNAVLTDLDILDGALCFPQEGSNKVCLSFYLNDFYANESTLTESSTIEVRFSKPKEMYDKIVAIDPLVLGDGAVSGASDAAMEGTESVSSDAALQGTESGSSDVAMETALLLKNIAENDPENYIKFYFTRMDGETSDVDQKKKLVSDCGADFLIVLDGTEAQEYAVKTYYNEKFFLRRLPNASFADIIERNSALNAGAQALGVEAGFDKYEMLADTKIPAAALNIGMPSGQESFAGYESGLAQGIYSGLLEAYKQME